MRERYWNFFVEMKHKSFYYKHFQALFNGINWLITAFLSFISLSCIAAWGVWHQYPILWACLICISQVVQALFPKLPYNDQLVATQFMISSFSKLLIRIEHDWLYIDINNLSDGEILTLMKKHQSKYDQLTSQFFSGYYLPFIRFCDRKAEEDCRAFFAVTYQISKGGDDHGEESEK